MQSGYTLRDAYFADDPGVFEVVSLPGEIMTTPIGRDPFEHWEHYLLTASFIFYREGLASTLR